jgi:hypothetical protein
LVQNIDPVYLLTPIVVIAFSFGLVFYWYRRRRFSIWAGLFSLGAYAGAIALKYVVSAVALGPLQSALGNRTALLGAYFGAETALFEVGGAFFVASIAVSRGLFGAKDSEGYGLGLAMWENGVLFALPLLINYVAYYSILSAPSTALAQTLYAQLAKDSPGLFYGNSEALPLVGYAILERVSSLLAHFTWGYLAVMAAVLRKRVYLAVALPIGFLVDFTVPYAQFVDLGLYELIVLVISLSGLAIALAVTREVRRPRPSFDVVPQDVSQR